MWRSGIFRLKVLLPVLLAAVPGSLILLAGTGSAQPPLFNYGRVLFGTPSTLVVWAVSVDPSTGVVQFNGGDGQGPSTPFTWYWGDGISTEGFFPQSHTYADPSRNYVVTVIAHYDGGLKDTTQALTRFVPASYQADNLPAVSAVTIPSAMPPLGTRLYTPPANLTVFDDSFFSQTPREVIESVLSLVAAVEMDFTNDDVYLFLSQFEQVMLRDSTFGGAYSLWFTDPVSFGVGDGFLQGSIGYSSLFHEMGHNFSLNTPADFYYGGRIDGPANAIYSETLAQLYQHAAGYALLNGQRLYGLPDDVIFEMRGSVISSMGVVRTWYENYLSGGMNYVSWNDPPTDAAMQTFMTLAYKFFEHAESAGMGYRAPLKRMLYLLQVFDQYLMDAFDRSQDTPEADSARATLLVTAISYAFHDDFRAEFAALNFPINDELYDELIYMAGDVNTVPALQGLIADASLSGCFDEFVYDMDALPLFSDADGDPLTYTCRSSDSGIVLPVIDGTLLRVGRVSAGTARVTVAAYDDMGDNEATAFYVSVDPDCDCACDCHADPDPGCDGALNVVDIVWAVNVAFRGGDPIVDPNPSCPREATDVDCDGDTDILDVVKLVSVAFRGGDPGTTFCDPCAP